MILAEVLKKYFGGQETSYERFDSGATNVTYKVTLHKSSGEEFFTLQKVNNSFDSKIIEDIEAVTSHLASKGILVQRVVRTLTGELFLLDGDAWWKMLTYMPGQTFNAVENTEQAHSAGELIGRWHTTLLNLSYEFKFKIPHFHETEFTMAELERTLEKYKNNAKYSSLAPLALDVLSSYQKLESVNLPLHIIHGDLKITNIIFDNSDKAVSIIDLDTFMYAPIVVELGDALRSWCMPGGEDVEEVKFVRDVYEAALAGYYATATFLTEGEKESIPYGVKLITLELTARFIIDAFNESYFKINNPIYKTLFEQNKKRAENQYAFFKAFSLSFP